MLLCLVAQFLGLTAGQDLEAAIFVYSISL